MAHRLHNHFLIMKRNPNPLVLLADDEPKTTKYLSRILHEKQVKTMTANNGIDALEFAVNHHFGAAVLDLRMPGADGLETCYKLKLASPATHVIIHSAYLTDNIRNKFNRLGIDAAYEKPAPVSELVEAIITSANVGQDAWERKHRTQEDERQRDSILRGYISDKILDTLPQSIDLVTSHNVLTVRDEIIDATLTYFSGHVRYAARKLGMAENTVRRWIADKGWNYDPRARKMISPDYLEIAGYIAKHSNRPNYLLEMPFTDDPEKQIRRDATAEFNLPFPAGLPSEEWSDLWDAWLMQRAVDSKARNDGIPKN